MESLLERCAGLDVHRAQVTACVRAPGAGQRVEHHAEFATTTADLLALRDWLTAHRVTHVAMEATGVFWKPVFYVLEDAFDTIVVNPAHMRNVPGRKTDVADAAWIAQLLECGLLRASFVPPQPIRELRDLTRYRKAQIGERQREANRLHKVLEDAGIKLSCVASDVLGVSGRSMVEALVAGTTDPAVLAELARGRLRAKLPALREALRGRFTGHHTLLCAQILAHLDFLDESIATLSTAVEEQLRPFAEHVARLCTIPGVARRTAEVLVAEIGVDMERFGSPERLASWAGMCPGNNESAGKRKTGRTTKGSRWLRTALIEAALAASRTKDTYLRAQYQRIRHNRGHKKAVVAVGHSILVIAYHLIRDGVAYSELGGDYFVKRASSDAAIRRHVRQLAALGVIVTIERPTAVA
jgi:transposase